MYGEPDTLGIVQKSARIKILYLPHSLNQMLRPDRMISKSEIRQVIFEGVVIEDYPDDARGHSCLMLGFGCLDRPIHVVCAPKDDYLAIITAYLPNADEWTNNFKMRKRKQL